MNFQTDVSDSATVKASLGYQVFFFAGFASDLAHVLLMAVPADHHINISADAIQNSLQVAKTDRACLVIHRCGSGNTTLVYQHHHGLNATGLKRFGVAVDGFNFIIESQIGNAIS